MTKLHWGTNNIDCLEGLKMLKDESIDLTITSPPYDNLREYKNGHSFDFEGIAKELYRVTKRGGSAFGQLAMLPLTEVKLERVLDKHCTLWNVDLTYMIL